ncbi:Cell division protein ftsZ, partial [Phytophthora palmivora]
MVHYTLAGRVNSEEYAICDRLLDILAVTLPDCHVTKLPSKTDHWPNDAAELMRLYGFNLPTSSNLVISDVVIWTDTGRLLCSDVDAFSTFVGRNYGIQLDLTEAEVLLYIKANGFKKARKDEDDTVQVEVEAEPASSTDVSAVPAPVVEKKLVPPAVSSNQPLWLTQEHPTADLS